MKFGIGKVKGVAAVKIEIYSFLFSRKKIVENGGKKL